MVNLYPTIKYPMPKRASDDYIQFCKKITNPQIIKGINEISSDKLNTPQELCYQFICEGVARELEKKKRLLEITRDNKRA